jgi:hypothetical protein
MIGNLTLNNLHFSLPFILFDEMRMAKNVLEAFSYKASNTWCVWNVLDVFPIQQVLCISSCFFSVLFILYFGSIKMKMEFCFFFCIVRMTNHETRQKFIFSEKCSVVTITLPHTNSSVCESRKNFNDKTFFHLLFFKAFFFSYVRLCQDEHEHKINHVIDYKNCWVFFYNLLLLRVCMYGWMYESFLISFFVYFTDFSKE